MLAFAYVVVSSWMWAALVFIKNPLILVPLLILTTGSTWCVGSLSSMAGVEINRFKDTLLCTLLVMLAVILAFLVVAHIGKEQELGIKAGGAFVVVVFLSQVAIILGYEMTQWWQSRKKIS